MNEDKFKEIWNECVEFNIEQKPEEYKGLLNLLDSKSKKGYALEIGSNYGGTAAGLCRIFEKVITIDIAYNPNFDKLKSKYPGYSYIIGNSTSNAVVDMIKSLGVKFDFIFIDGDHSYEGVRNDYEKFKQFLASDGFMAFHDIVYSEENLQNNARVDILWNELNTYGLEKYQFVSRLRNHSYRTDQLFYTFVSKRPYESWGGIGVIKNSPIGLFCHSYLKNHWYDVVLSQLVKLQNSGLYKRADKIVYGVQSERDDNYYTLLDIIKQYDVDSKIEVYRHNKNMYEYSTLMHLQNYCAQNPNASVLYYHTKGTSREFDKNIESWRECLEYFNIEQWRRCFDAVNSDRHDVCGAMYVNWFKFLDIEMKNYYSGNFWWAQAKHINTLDNLGAVMLQNNAKRDYCELWLGSKPHRWASLYSISLNSWYDHYFDPKDYKNV